MSPPATLPVASTPSSSLISIWTPWAAFRLRLLVGDLDLRYQNIPRLPDAHLRLLPACVGHLLIAFGVVLTPIYVASVIIGFCFRSQWPLLLRHQSSSHLYDREAERQNAGHPSPARSGSKDLTCIGVNCFRESFLIIVAVTVLGAVISLVLVFRTRKFYRGDIYARFRSTELPAAVATGGEETELSTSCSNLPNVKKLGERELQSSSNHM
ncbi:hypothetical protein AXF42_Ash000167 [Apostasia shenzhenica]|uniref:Uncharacterized protein n=1 Tax=Apostasia shenzhenica TaxID=1088818 RepID=A0A2I0AFK0_9ASPA|nr:hypothetical protein AXF42_Ash000167 [Apostasia shenzhenica]